jgi:carbon-monoxide dehydrogenase large subunit
MNEIRSHAARFVGRRMPRKEDRRLLTGRGVFTDDVRLPGMLHAAFARSPVARGTIRGVDVEAARATPGVRAVFVAEDFDRFDIEMVSFYNVSPPPGPRTWPLARGRVAFAGDPVAIVVADSRAIAEDAAALVFVDIEAEAPVVTIAEARAGAKVHPDLDSNIAKETAPPRSPELDAAFSQAAHVLTGNFRHQRVSQAPMEGRACICDPHGEQITVYLSCQSPQMAAKTLTMVFRDPNRSFRVLAKDVGGAFGLKTQVWLEEVSVVAAAMLLSRPVKWTEDRLENFISANSAREQQAVLRLALDKTGKFLASDLDYHINNGAWPHMPEDNAMVGIFCWPFYKMPAFGFTSTAWHTNTVGLGGYRGPWAMESFIREVLIDDAARQLGVEPVELRRRNIITRADQPATSVMGLPLEDVTPAECLDQLLTKIDIPAFRQEQAKAREAGRYLGLGIATYFEPTGGSGINVLSSDVAQIRIEPSGKVNAVLSTHSQGHGTETTMAQVIADRLGVPFEDISIHESDSSAGGYGAGAAGSRQAIAGGGAAIRASDLLLGKVKKIAAHLLNASPEDVSLEAGVVRVAGAEPMSRSLKEIAAVAYGEPDRLPPDVEMGLEATYRYHPPQFTFASAANACIAEVDVTTGMVEIKRWVVSEDCGVVINPGVVEGQVTGGLAQAIGMVLLEQLTYDADGNPTVATFKDYLMPTIHDVPEFEFLHLCTPAKGEGGFRGVGEGGAIIGVPTLVNAIADALSPFGVKCHELPLTPSRILELIEGGAVRADRAVSPG